MATVQYRVVVTKGDERTAGPDDAAVVLTVPIDDAEAPDFDANVAFMRGRLKAAGHSGLVLDALKSGAATSELHALAAAARMASRTDR